MRKSLGNKRKEITLEQIEEIKNIYEKFEESENSKIFDNEDFGYRKVTVLQPELNEDGTPKKNKKGEYIPSKELTDTENIKSITIVVDTTTYELEFNEVGECEGIDFAI